MTKVPHAGQHHGDAALIRSGDYLVVAHATAWLNHAGRTCIDDDIKPITEGEKCIGRDS
jgi:hypothetical protein